MITSKNRNTSAALVLLLSTALVSCQITFSRDWSGGKRAPPVPPQLAVDCAQFTRLCRHFIHDLKQAVSSQMGGKERRRPGSDLTEDSPPTYDDVK